MSIIHIFLSPIGCIISFFIEKMCNLSKIRNIVIIELINNHLAELLEIIITNKQEEAITNILAARRQNVIKELLSSDRMDVITFLYSNYKNETILGINQLSNGSIKYVPKEPIQIIIGAANTKYNGWISTDIESLDITSDRAWSSLFHPESIQTILAEHVLEHLTIEELQMTLSLIHRYLKKGGVLRLAVPDAFHPSRYYYNLVKPGGYETFKEHKIFLDYKIFSQLATDFQFSIHLLEYFDENGFFHKTSYTDEFGIIQRNSKNNVGINLKNPEIVKHFYDSIPEHLRQQFYDNNMTYTSLIVDLVK